jgi:flagellar basal-body rod modification protein FlgD
MSISTVSSAGSATDPTAAAMAAASSGAGMEQRFLTLLTTQLNNQDPLNPLDNAQLTSQLAQMSTVSGIEQMNTSLQSLLAQGSANQLLQAGAMVGKSVLVSGDVVQAGNGSADFGVRLPSPAQSVQVTVSDAAGNVVRTLDLGTLPSGLSQQSWDGNNDAGQPVPAGAYRISVQAANGASAVAATSLVFDQVASVAQGTNGGFTLELAGGGSAQLSDVQMLR